MVSDFVIQAGAMMIVGESPGLVQDSLKDMIFVGVSRQFSVGNGTLTAGAMYGMGDFSYHPLIEYRPGLLGAAQLAI